jgi:hypothetical protein
MNLFKNITKIEELVQIIRRIYMIYTKNLISSQKLRNIQLCGQAIHSIFMGSNVIIEVD